MKNHSFFLGANSEYGFVSYYQSVDSDKENTAVFNVIGGPGTGKSTLLKKIVKSASQNGFECETYFCSSDPYSLDAVRLFSANKESSVFVCDATAPHARELSTPGAVTRIVDLTTCWDEGMLAQKRGEIIALQKEKANEYANAYSYLKLAGQVMRKAVCLRQKELKSDFIDEIFSDYRFVKEKIKPVIRPIRAISMIGEETLDNQGYSAKTRFFVENEADCSIICKALFDKYGTGEGAYLAPNPIVNEYYDEIYFKSTDLCISLADKSAPTKINLNEYVEKKNEEYIGMIEIYNYLKTAALNRLADAREAHFALESIYGEAMDFDKKDKLDETVVNIISHILQ